MAERKLSLNELYVRAWNPNENGRFVTVSITSQAGLGVMLELNVAEAEQLAQALHEVATPEEAAPTCT